MADKSALPYARVVGMHNALSILSRRILPTISADLKVVRLFRALTPTVEEFNSLRRKIIDAHTVNEKLDEAAATAAIMPLFDLDSGFTLPDIRITEADLPVKTAGENGEKNREGIASIIIDLHDLYTDASLT